MGRVPVPSVLKMLIGLVLLKEVGSKQISEPLSESSLLNSPFSDIHTSLKPWIVRARIKDGDSGSVQDVFINDKKQEEITRIHNPYYDIFIIKNFKLKTAMLLIFTKKKYQDKLSVRHCEEWSLKNSTFLPTDYFMKTKIDKNNGHDLEIKQTKIPKHWSQFLKYRSCGDIPRELFEDITRQKRQSLETYGQWCGRWEAPVFKPCCSECLDPSSCIAANCTPFLDQVDEACVKFTFCKLCWADLPNKALPHCDCVRDLTRDLKEARCFGLLPGDCYNYRSRLYGFMSNSNCWGRLTLKITETYQCGFKQDSCNSGSGCQVVPQLCFRKSMKILNNFKCVNHHTCEETFRRLRSGSQPPPSQTRPSARPTSPTDPRPRPNPVTPVGRGSGPETGLVESPVPIRGERPLTSRTG
ncbi:hypothetical protein LOTGIDRAFT_233438 [Lottia gigantea]|uniref:Uncharacterized protein n=1 Tax=Lottia gigantea TaxID=225164 RepID=V4BRX5_LOTGI|nr:hypothetical protein LOTGIDRAFT_233438 [Lottia gigantea]ESO91674.1 hypothetical protein LOTGIDRAFT_233438 [Lottia gigantea]